MKGTRQFLVDAAVGGIVAGMATTLAAAALGEANDGRPLGPINATSHILWGDEAGRAPHADLKHTVPGVLLNVGAGVFWAAAYEALFGDRRGASRALAGGVAVAALAYVVDYHVVPRRLTPGWEFRLSPLQLAAMYAVLAASLPARKLAARSP